MGSGLTLEIGFGADFRKAFNIESIIIEKLFITNDLNFADPNTAIQA